MKKITLSIVMSLILCIFHTAIAGAREVEAMEEKVIRIHIIANSDSEADQSLKLSVRDAVLKTVAEAVEGVGTKAEAMEKIRGSLPEIEKIARKTVESGGKAYPVAATLKREEFGERVYDGFTLPAGSYDSLCIRLGEAVGRNWWCVLYPSLCVGSAVSAEDCGVFTEGEIKILREPEKVRCKLWCFEALRKLKKFLSDI